MGINEDIKQLLGPNSIGFERYLRWLAHQLQLNLITESNKQECADDDYEGTD